MHALPRFLDRVLGGTLLISRWAAYFGGGAIVVSAFLISVDVLARRIFGLSTWGADELSYYALAISVSWGLGYALLVKAHIRIDLITSHLPNFGQMVLHVLALASMAYLGSVWMQAFWHVFKRSWTRGSTSITTLATPLWIPQGLFLAGVIFLVFCSALLIVRVLVAYFIEGDMKVVNRVAGVVSAEEETEEAVAEALAIKSRNG